MEIDKKNILKFCGFELIEDNEVKWKRIWKDKNGYEWIEGDINIHSLILLAVMEILNGKD